MKKKPAVKSAEKVAVKLVNPEFVALSKLKPHPRNYRTHPDDQLNHLGQSLREHGLFRNVVTARDWTILAGHGLVEAAKREGMDKILAIKLDVAPSDARALKIMAGDNEIAHLAETDDRKLSDMLREIKDFESGLFGTGYDDQMLAALAMITRPQSEIEDANEAAHWAGMPGFQPGAEDIKLSVHFRTDADREAFVKEFKIVIRQKEKTVWKTWWPEKEKDDVSSVRFES